jgi:hypothetical protein
MIKDKVEWKGTTPEQVVAIVEKVKDDVFQVAYEVIQEIQTKVIGRTPIGDTRTDPHAGQLITSWGHIQESDVSFSFSTDVPYAIILEKGLYTGVGPRTVPFEGGIFSSQAPGGMVTPIVTDPNLIKEVVRMLIERISKTVGGKSA